MFWPPDENNDAICGFDEGGKPGGGGITCRPLAATVSAPATSMVISPWEVTVLFTVRSPAAPAVVMAVVPFEVQSPLTVIGPVLVTATWRPLSEVTRRTPALARLTSPENAKAPKFRSPAFVSLKSPCMLEPFSVPEMRFGPLRLTEPCALRLLKPAAWMKPPPLSVINEPKPNEEMLL